ncbi:MAG: IS630 family transposase [Pseudonocardia sp.]|nr:IS630 family transposase [Pseudonocardia sp.]
MRPPEVFVRELSPEEGRLIKQRSRRGKHFATRQRAMIVLASNTGMSAPEIARALASDESHVRKVIHDFNERGLDCLRPRYRGGRPRRITIDQRERIVALAGARPEVKGAPLTRWSLPHLARHLAGRGITVSTAHLGRLLDRAGLSFQRTRSWLASPDPDYEARAARVQALYRCCPKDGVVISFDEGGPYSLCPQHGHGWAARKRPQRLRARYSRRHGVRFLFGAYDVHADYLRARLRPRKTGAEVLAFMKTIRLAYPRRQRIYWIQDNLSAHWTPAIRTWATENNVELVPTPTYASYLNRIECHLGAIGEMVVKNSDYPDWQAFARAMAEHIRYRNTRAERDERILRAERRRLVKAA